MLESLLQVGRPGSAPTDSGSMPTRFGRRSWRGRLGYALLAVVAVELLSGLAIGIVNQRVAVPILRRAGIYERLTVGTRELLDAHRTGGRVVFDAHLGFRYRPGYRSPERTLNAQGLRASREYAAAPPDGVLRVAAFGDSFVFSTEVADAESWAHQLEAGFPAIEVLNYGNGAYGTGQAYLRFLADGTQLAPSVVLIGFSPVMMRRTTNRFRPFLGTTFNPLVKPRFRLIDGELESLPPPIEAVEDYARYLEAPERFVELAEHDGAYRLIIFDNPLYDVSATVRFLTGTWIKIDNRYLRDRRVLAGGVFDEDAESFRVQLALMEAFVAAVRAAAMAPIVVVLPDDHTIARDRAGRSAVYEPLLAALDDRGIERIDLLEAFREVRPRPAVEDWFMPGRHYSPAANRIVAEHIGRALTGRFVRSPAPAGTRTR